MSNAAGQKFCGECGTPLSDGGGAAERKYISALFCDVVGSTALGDALDPEHVARVMDEYVGLCRDVIEMYGGVIQKFIGDAVVAIFGVPVVHEDDPERAVRAALRILDRLRESDLSLQVRIGVQTGEALVRPEVDPRSGASFATGDCLNIASRLQAVAPVDAVVVGGPTYRATQHSFEYEVLQPVSVKGKSEPVEAFRPLAPVARPSTELSGDVSPFVGREFELESLVRLFNRTHSSASTQFVTIIAEAGFGKSRLVRELARHIDSLPDLVTWRQGRCLSYGDAAGFWALGEIVKAHSGIYDDDDQATIKAKLERVVIGTDPQDRAWMIDRLAPLVGLDTATAPPERAEAFTAWQRFCESMTADGSAVLVIEDLHWADSGLVAFLEHVARRTVDVPLLVVVTARPDVSERHGSWPPARRSTVLSLMPLDDTELTAMLAPALPAASDQIRSVVIERAGGSPLFAEQLAATLRAGELGAIRETDAASAIPPTVQALIAARIDALPGEARQLLREASVIGTTFWPGALRAFGRHDEVDDNLAELIGLELVRPVTASSMGTEPEYAFWHALVRDVAYQGLTRADRGRLHTATAHWIADTAGEHLGETAQLIVHHLDQAAAFDTELEPDDERLLQRSLLEAGALARRIDLIQAAELLQRALERLNPHAPERHHTTLDVGDVLFSLGKFGQAVTLLKQGVEDAMADGEFEPAAELMVTLDAAQWSSGIDPDEQLMGMVRDRLRANDAPALAQILTIDARDAYVRSDYEQAASLAGEAVRWVEECGKQPPIRTLEVLAGAELAAGDLDAEKRMQDVADTYLANGHIGKALSVYGNLGTDISGFEPVRALAIVDHALTLANKVGAEYNRWALVSVRLEAECFLGRYDDVIAEAGPALEYTQEHSAPAIRLIVLACLAVVQIDRGGALVDPEELAVLGRRYGVGLDVAAYVYAELGQPSKAAPLLREYLDQPDAYPPMTAACVALAIGEPELLHTIVQRPLSRNTRGEASRQAIAGLLAAHQGHPEEGARHLRAAADTFETIGMIPYQVVALTHLGRCLLTLDRADEARIGLDQALQLAKRMRATRRIDEIVGLLQELEPQG